MPRRHHRPEPLPPRWQRRPAARPEEILRAALAVFGAAGYADARLSDIAAAAGLSKATLYLYFDSKAGLFREMIRNEARGALSAESAAAGFFPDTPEKRLRRLLRESWQALRRPALASLARLVHAEGARFPELGRLFYEEVVLELRRRLAVILDDGRARGVFRTVPHDFALSAVPSLLLQEALQRDSWGGFDAALPTDEEVIEGCWDLLLHGLLRRGSRTAAE